MLVHASCGARSGHGVLLFGPSGSGKSDLLLRLLDRGFDLVADDQVEVAGGVASPPPSLAGLLEVRGLGIMRLPFAPKAALALAVELGVAERMPSVRRHPLDLPLVTVDPSQASACCRVEMALDCATGRSTQLAGAFA